MIFSSPIILLQSFKPKNPVKKKSLIVEMFDSSEVSILKVCLKLKKMLPSPQTGILCASYCSRLRLGIQI